MPFKIGQTVRIIRPDMNWTNAGEPFCGRLGIITDINGEYHYVRPLGYKHEDELYSGEITEKDADWWGDKMSEDDFFMHIYKIHARINDYPKTKDVLKARKYIKKMKSR